MDQIESIHGRASAHTRHSIVLVVALNRLGQCEKKSINLTEGIGLMDWIVGLWQSWNPGTFRGGLRSTRNEDRGYTKNSFTINNDRNYYILFDQEELLTNTTSRSWL